MPSVAPRPTAETAPRGQPAWLALVEPNGEVKLRHRDQDIATLVPELFDHNWQQRTIASARTLDVPKDRLTNVITAPDGTKVDSLMEWAPTNTGVRLVYTLTPAAQVKLNSLHVALNLPIRRMAGRNYMLDGTSGKVPAELGSDIHLAEKDVRSLELDTSSGKIQLNFSTPTHVLIQDNRRWGPELTVRLGNQRGPTWAAKLPMTLSVELSAEAGMTVERDSLVTIQAGAQWAPLAVELDIEPSSALDFSGLRPTGSPAGAQGRVLASPAGHFVFERDPKTPRRFYGINLCFTAQYLAHDQADRLAIRLARLGYNTVRIHHYEGELVSAGSGLDGAKLGQKPTSTQELTSFETPADVGDNYTSRIRAFLYPPATGQYVFKIASDDDGELWLSSDEGPGSRKRIAEVRGWADRRQWDKYESQSSKPATLEAGKKYYIEALHREGSGGDHIEVGWAGPGIAFSVIDGRYLSPSSGGGKGKIFREIFPEKPLDNSLTLNPDRLDQLEYLVFALKKNGIYITTDLFVSRPVLARELWPDAQGNVGMNEFKMAVPVNQKAWENWKAFAKNLLTHKNPYTRLRWADDPGVAWLSMINEGTFGNYINGLEERVKRDWRARYNTWLARKYRSRQALQKAWGEDPGG
ncbi:MAG TPA: PA14 domain-containing protein, partial [Polyangiaceae bacterium]